LRQQISRKLEAQSRLWLMHWQPRQTSALKHQKYTMMLHNQFTVSKALPTLHRGRGQKEDQVPICFHKWYLNQLLAADYI
jgi:hypothetical protein